MKITPVSAVTFVRPVRRIIAGRRGQQQPTEIAATEGDSTAPERIKLKQSPNAGTAVDIKKSDSTISGMGRVEGQRNRAQKPKKIRKNALRGQSKTGGANGAGSGDGQHFNTKERSKGFEAAMQALVASLHDEAPQNFATAALSPHSVTILQTLGDKILEPVPPSDFTEGLAFIYAMHQVTEKLAKMERGKREKRKWRGRR